jgi:hypothetical protein
MATEITLSRTWKQSLTTSKMQPFAMQVSLWDLLFFENANGETCVRYIQNPQEINWKCKGLELPHSIIVFDEKIYLKPDKVENRVGHRIIKKGYTEIHTEEEILKDNLTVFDRWSSLGFDISLPWFDVRSKPLFLKSTNVSKYVSGSTVLQFNSLLSGISPEKLKSSDFYFNAAEQTGNSSVGFKIWDKDAALKPQTSYDFYKRSPLKPSTALTANTWEDYPDPWYIASEEDYIDEWVTSNGSKSKGTTGADIILCNKDTSFEKRFIIPESGLSAYNGVCLNYNSPRVWKILLNYYQSQNLDYELWKSLNFVTEYEVSINPILNYLLKHCYVWFKCAFFADYIDYRDFNQSLNQKSQVIHNNLILGKGDFKRYEELYSDGKISATDKAKNTRPYFPTTTPIKDKVKETLLNSSDLEGNFATILEKIIDDAASPESKIGSLPIEPFEDFNTSEKSPNFTTKAITDEPPPIWFDTESRKTVSDYLDYPILIGKDGNLITTGRLLSPSIDELWQTLKEIIAGKMPDTRDITSEDMGGYPRNTTTQSINSKDTRLILPTHKFKDENGNFKEGDPTEINIQADNVNPDNLVYRVKTWINNPDMILYNVIKDLKEVSDEICSIGPNLEVIINKIENLPKPTEYLPMATVPSLRELEGIIKGIKWNLAYYIKFMLYNGVYVGSNGKLNSDNTPYNNSAGTAYLLHKNKNLTDKSTPDTVYDERINRNISVSFGEGVSQITKDMFGNNNQDIVPPWTVFMSAAGTWQSVSQAINIRIRDDEIW